MDVRTLFMNPRTGILRSGWRIVAMMLAFIPLLVAVGLASRAIRETLPMPALLALKALLAAAMISGALGIHRAFVRRVERREPAEAKLDGGAVRAFGLGLLLGAGPMLLITAILAAAGCYRVAGLNELWAPLRALIFYLPQSFVEDFAFCLVLYRLLREGIGPRAALLVAPALFALAHGANANESLLGLGEILTGGCLMYALYERTGRFWAVWGLHFGWNFTMSGLLGMANSGQMLKGLVRASVTGPTWLTGGATGPEASVLALGLDLLLLVLVLRMPSRRPEEAVPELGEGLSTF